MQITTAIITPTWNNEEYTIRCFDSIRKNTKNYIIIWIDNGSKDASREKVQKFLDVHNISYELIQNDENRGFVKATNQGMQRAMELGVEYIVLQNNDTEVYEGWLDRYIEIAKNDKKIGLVGPITSPCESWQSIEKLKKSCDDFEKFPVYSTPKQYNRTVRKINDQGVVAVNEYLAFFSVLIKKAVIEDIGYLSEEYGIGLGDDNDYCARAIKAQWKLALAKNVFVFHNHRTTFKSIYTDKDIKSMQRNAQKILDQKNVSAIDMLDVDVQNLCKKDFDIIENKCPYCGASGVNKKHRDDCKSKSPLISVIIPSRVGEEIESLKTLRMQTYQNIEIIVEYDTKQEGASKVRNVGAQKAHGQFLFFCDNDLVLNPNCLSDLYLTLRKSSVATWVFGKCVIDGHVLNEGKIMDVPHNKKTVEWLTYFYCISTMSLIDARIKPVFDEKMKRFNDWDLWLSLNKEGYTPLFCDTILFATKNRVQGITNSDPKNIKQWIEKLVQKYDIQIALSDIEKIYQRVEILPRQINDLQKEISLCKKKIADQDAELVLMKSSKFWKVRMRYMKVKNKFYKIIKPFSQFIYSVKNEKSRETLMRIVHYILYGKGVLHKNELCSSGDACIRNVMDTSSCKTFAPKVSIIVPNYNHATFLEKRLDSIYNQSYTNYEVILLDDCSTDDSIKILQEYAEKYSEKTTCLFNKKNSGSVFCQWEKGIKNASGELIWIAESDDFCDKNFLEELVGFFYDESIMLAYAHPIFVNQNGKKHTGTFENYVSQLSSKKWKKNYIETAHREVNCALGIKNTIPNVSGVVLRNVFTDFNFSALKDFTVCGDWFLYLNVIKGGRIAYSIKTNNYYRMHPESTSLNYQKNIAFIKEHESIAKFVAQNFNITDYVLEKNMQAVQETWFHHKKGEKSFRSAYNLSNVKRVRQKRKPHILIAIFAFSTGGGETVPIRIANELYRRGYTVTVFDYCYFGREHETTRSFLHEAIPVFRSENRNIVNSLLDDFGVDIIHSHHVINDMYFSERRNRNIPLVVTMHGMYENLSQDELVRAKNATCDAVSHWTYVADKNIEPLLSDTRIDQNCFSKIPNGFRFDKCDDSIKRSAFSIKDSDFLICLASRAIKEKGWKESIAAVQLANKTSQRKIKLLLIGDGPVYDELQKSDLGKDVQLLGFQENVACFFAISDLGLLPTTFKGESYPMTLIECVSSGTPFFATDVGEIRHMLATSDGEMAGEVFAMCNGEIDVQELASMLVVAANDAEYYTQLQNATEKCKNAFSIDSVIDSYEKIYSTLIHK
ncbi:MAG: hypothetical protein CR972_00115 [Candidatus Moraniibacteriota bacterium]|nr:MAG: hypothetical protein CR972_00115 [Candidatus Moranbacteria bacterium]